MTALRSFEGQEVIGARVKVTNAGDGLSDAMSIDPEEYPIGTHLTVVMQTVVTRASYEPVPKTDSLMRVHTLRAGLATIVDGGVAAPMLEEQRVKIEEAKGIKRLPLDEDGDGDGDSAKKKTAKKAPAKGKAAAIEATSTEPADGDGGTPPAPTDDGGTQ